MGFFDVSLWPTGLVVSLAVIAIAAMRLLDRAADRLAVLRTRRALQRTLADPTEE